MNLIFDLSYIFIITPCIEYFVHRILHKINNTIHKQHHIEVSKNHNDIEYWGIVSLIIFYYYNCYYLYIGLLKYMIIHYLIHNHPDILPTHIVNHHKIHHLYPNCNYGISSIYPDAIFNTNLFKKKFKV